MRATNVICVIIRMVLALPLVSLMAPLSCAHPTSLPSGPISTGNQLYELCRTDSPDCLGYVVGVADTAGLMTARWGICIPPGTSVRQTILSFQAYASQNPSTMTASAADLVLRGLQKQFPCKPISN